jgi:AcrR family transcriptional regulator
VAAKKRAARSTYHHGDLRNALVASAIDVISTGGPELITLREVSRRVGVNHRAVYRHFSDLTALLAAVAEQGYRQLTAAMREALAALPRATAEKRVEAIALAYLTFALDHPSHYRIMFGRRLNEDGRFPELEELINDAYAVLAEEIAKGQRAGRFADFPLREAVFAFWSMTHGFASLTLVRRIKLKRSLLESYSRQLFAPFLAGLSAR